MALPVTIPNTFANATSSIPLSQLDTNFSTLANAVNGLNSGSETLANLKATTANVGVLTVTGNATIGDASTDTVTLNSTLTANTAVIFAAGTSAAPSITTTGDTNTGIFFPAADTIAFAEGGAEAMRIDPAGNLGLGVTPNTWAGTGVKAFQFQNGSLAASGTFGTWLSWNAYTDGTIKYISNNTAARYLIEGNVHRWDIAPSGTAGNAITFTQAMTLDASGRLGIGKTPSHRLDVGASSGTVAVFTQSSATGYGMTIIPGADTSYDAFTINNAANTLNQIQMYGNGTARFAGSVSVGGATPTTSGAGITFPATQSASSDANTLDDYEEGTWTPTIQFSLGSVGQTYSVRDGFYTKVGNLVTVTCYVSLSNKGSSTGNAQLGGLPFTVGQYSTSGLYLDNVSFSGYPAIYAEKNQSYVVFLQQPAAGGASSALTNTNFVNTSGVMVNVSYQV